MQRKKISFYYLILINSILISNVFSQSSITDFEITKLIDWCDYKNVKLVYVNGNISSTDSLLWDFGDGVTKGNSFTDHVIYTYNDPGTFTISLTVWKGGIETYIEKPNAISIYNPPTVSYTYNSEDSAFIAPVSVNFESNVQEGDGKIVSYNWFEYTTAYNIGTTENVLLDFETQGATTIGLQVTDENGCIKSYSEEIIIKDSIQANEFEFLIGDCNSNNCTDGYNYTLENDTLLINGQISLNCCGTHTTAYESVSDSLIFHFYSKGEHCSCNCMYCFEIKVSDIFNNYKNVQFDNVDTLIVKDGVGFIDSWACDMYISPSGKKWIENGIYQDTIPSTMGGDSIIIIRLNMYESSSTTLNEEACISYISPSGKLWTVSNTYKDTISNSVDCDSIITINLTIDCTNSIYYNKSIPLSVYPNPAKEYINIRLNESYQDIIIEVFDITGSVTSKNNYKNVNQLIYKLNEPQGIFFMKIYNGEGEMSIVKIVKD